MFIIANRKSLDTSGLPFNRAALDFYTSFPGKRAERPTEKFYTRQSTCSLLDALLVLTNLVEAR